MPRYTDDDNMVIGNVGTFQFSGVRPDNLGATEYTLVTIVLDVTGSVASFADQLIECVKASVDACRKSPRANNLLIRYVIFNDRVMEQHGFIPLTQVDMAKYTRPICNGSTALRDACYASVGASNDYAKMLNDQDYAVNAIVFVITDGDDNVSRMSTVDVLGVFTEAVKAEYMESLTSVLIGINTQICGAYLDKFSKDVGFSQYVDAGNVNKDSLARLAAFVSKSISSTSTSLGSGKSGPLQSLSF